MPLPGPWRHGSIKGFLANFVTKGLAPLESGSGDEQVDGCCKVAPLVALYAGSPNLLPTVEKAVRVTQNTDTAVAFACGFARVLESLMLGSTASVAEACAEARSALRDPSKCFSTPLDRDVDAALSLVEEFATVPPSQLGAKVQAVLDLPRHSTALS